MQPEEKRGDFLSFCLPFACLPVSVSIRYRLKPNCCKPLGTAPKSKKSHLHSANQVDCGLRGAVAAHPRNHHAPETY